MKNQLELSHFSLNIHIYLWFSKTAHFVNKVYSPVQLLFNENQRIELIAGTIPVK